MQTSLLFVRIYQFPRRAVSSWRGDGSGHVGFWRLGVGVRG